MTYVDTHSHVYASEFDVDRELVLQRASEAGVERILLPAIDSSTHHSMLELEQQRPDQCVSMMGLHPCSVKEDYERELALAEQYLGERKFIGVGEIGLDFYWDLQFTSQQYEAFRRQLGWARQYRLPVSIHSRQATDECIQTVEAMQDGNLRGVFHCFSGSTEQAQRAIGAGFALGIGGVLTFKNAGLDRVVREIGLEHLVLETDAPYLAPVPFRGKRNEPAHLAQVAQKLADIKEVNVEEAARMTTENARKLFGF